MQNRILLFHAYFGPLPAWFPLFLHSCAHNPEVDFFLVTDQDPGPLPANVRGLRCSFADFHARLETLLGISLPWQTPYKFCDLKPVMGLLFEPLLKGYSHWGYCDNDVIFGRIARFYDAEVLSYDVISPRNWLLAGHLFLLRNCPELLRLFACVPDWRERFADPKQRFFDEITLTQIIYGGINHRDLKQAPQSKVSFTVNGKVFRSLYREQYPTFLEPQLWKDGTFRMPGHWEWRNGVLSAPFLDNSEMLYLHFTHWCSSKWTKDGRAAWAGLDHIVDPRLGPAPAAFDISPRGLHLPGEAP